MVIYIIYSRNLLVFRFVFIIVAKQIILFCQSATRFLFVTCIA